MSIVRKISTVLGLIVGIPFLVVCYLYSGIFENISESGKIIIFITGIIVFLGVIALLKLTKSLGQLHKKLADVAKGNIAAKAKVDHSSGLGEMTLSVNDLISRLKNNADELEKRAFLVERANREFKSRVDFQERNFLNVIHDLRAPLINIDKSIILILNKEVGEINSDQEKFLKIVNNNCNRLKASIDSLLEVSKLKSGKLLINIEEFNVQKMIEEAVSSVNKWAASRNINIKINIGPKVSAVYADKDKIIQVLVNLLSNAIKFTLTGGNISIDAVLFDSVVKAGVLRSKTLFLKLSVKDTGRGMTGEQKSQVFERFESSKDQGIKGIVGTGLGLPIAREIIKLHRGRIWVESELDKGSKFTLIIPMNKLAQGEKKVNIEEHNVGKKILIIDDEAIVRDLLSSSLKKVGYRVSIAKDGIEGIKKVIKENYNLVITDVRMPGIDGADCIQILKNFRPGVQLMVITGFSVGEELQNLLKTNNYQYLKKPLDLPDFINKVNEQCIVTEKY